MKPFRVELSAIGLVTAMAMAPFVAFANGRTQDGVPAKEGPTAIGSPRSELVESIRATVDGEAITARELARRLPPDASASVELTVLRQLVVERLIDQKARAAKIKIDDERLSAALNERKAGAGGKRGYDLMLAAVGKTAEEDRLEIRRALAADEYLKRCLGESRDPALMRPALVRLLEVSGKEIQDCWRENRDRFRRPGSVNAALVIARKPSGQPSSNQSRSNQPAESAGAPGFESALDARNAIATALEGKSASELEAATKADGRLSYATRVLSGSESEIAALLPALRPTAESGAVGSVSAVAESDDAFLALGILAREPAVEPTFDEAIDYVRAFVVHRKREAAVGSLVEELIAEARIWPADLFVPPSAK